MPSVSTGNPIVDEFLGCPGFPRGCITVVEGDGDLGKTTLSLKAIAQAQRNGLKVAYVDTGYRFKPDYARRLGVDLGALTFCQPKLSPAIYLPVAIAQLAKTHDLLVVDDVDCYFDGEEGSFRRLAQSLLDMHASLRGETCAVVLNVSGHRGIPLVLKYAAFVRLLFEREDFPKTARVRIIKTMAAPTQGNSVVIGVGDQSLAAR